MLWALIGQLTEGMLRCWLWLSVCVMHTQFVLTNAWDQIWVKWAVVVLQIFILCNHQLANVQSLSVHISSCQFCCSHRDQHQTHALLNWKLLLVLFVAIMTNDSQRRTMSSSPSLPSSLKNMMRQCGTSIVVHGRAVTYTADDGVNHIFNFFFFLIKWHAEQWTFFFSNITFFSSSLWACMCICLLSVLW